MSSEATTFNGDNTTTASELSGTEDWEDVGDGAPLIARNFPSSGVLKELEKLQKEKQPSWNSWMKSYLITNNTNLRIDFKKEEVSRAEVSLKNLTDFQTNIKSYQAKVREGKSKIEEENDYLDSILNRHSDKRISNAVEVARGKVNEFRAQFDILWGEGANLYTRLLEGNFTGGELVKAQKEIAALFNKYQSSDKQQGGNHPFRRGRWKAFRKVGEEMHQILTEILNNPPALPSDEEIGENWDKVSLDCDVESGNTAASANTAGSGTASNNSGALTSAMGKLSFQPDRTAFDLELRENPSETEAPARSLASSCAHGQLSGSPESTFSK